MTWNPMTQQYGPPPTLTLAGFLYARIAEDARVALCASARAAGGPYRAKWEAPFSAEVDPGAGGSFSTNDRDLTQHVIRWDPARVLAECEAKRQIVELHAAPDHMCPGEPVEWLGIRNRADGPYPYTIANCATLTALALPYADHPDFLEEWRP